MSKGQERKVGTMSNEMIAVYAWLGFIGSLALICFVIAKVTDFINKRKDKKRHKEIGRASCRERV